MQSAARFGPRESERRLWPLLLVIVLGIVVIGAFTWIALGPDRPRELAVGIGVRGTADAWLWPREPVSDPNLATGQFQSVGGPLAAKVPLSTGEPEDARAYLDRMLAALTFDGRPVEIQFQGSYVSKDERWILRWTTFLARAAGGGLTQLHLLTVRERSRDWMTPYLLSTDAPDGPMHVGGPFDVWLDEVSYGRASGVHDLWSEIPKILRLDDSRTFMLYGEPLRSATAQQLLDRHGETEWVVVRPPAAQRADAGDPPDER